MHSRSTKQKDSRRRRTTTNVHAITTRAVSQTSLSTISHLSVGQNRASTRLNDAAESHAGFGRQLSRGSHHSHHNKMSSSSSSSMVSRRSFASSPSQKGKKSSQSKLQQLLSQQQIKSKISIPEESLSPKKLSKKTDGKKKTTFDPTVNPFLGASTDRSHAYIKPKRADLLPEHDETHPAFSKKPTAPTYTTNFKKIATPPPTFVPLENHQSISQVRSLWGIQDVLDYLKTQKISQCIVFDTISSSPVCDYTIVCTVASSKPMHSLIEKLVALGKANRGLNYKNYSAGTDPDGLWAVADLSTITVHVLTPAGRAAPAFQRVERRLLSEARLIPFTEWDMLKDSYTLQQESLQEDTPEWTGPGLPPPGFYLRPKRPPINPVEEPYTSDEQFDYLDLNEEHMNRIEMLRNGNHDALQLDTDLFGLQNTTIDIVPVDLLAGKTQSSKKSNKNKSKQQDFVDIDDISAPYNDTDDDDDDSYHHNSSKSSRYAYDLAKSDNDASDFNQLLRELSEAEPEVPMGGDVGHGLPHQSKGHMDFGLDYKSSLEITEPEPALYQDRTSPLSSDISQKRYEDLSRSALMERNAGYASISGRMGGDDDDDNGYFDDDDDSINALSYMKQGVHSHDHDIGRERNLAMSFAMDTDVERINDITAEDATYQLRFDGSDRASEEDYFTMVSELDDHYDGNFSRNQPIASASASPSSSLLVDTDTETNMGDILATARFSSHGNGENRGGSSKM